MAAGPLAGLRVLELATGVAGPYAGRLLNMLGATVVKAEPPGGDPARTLAVDDGDQARPSAVFTHLNAGKRLVGLAGLHLPAARRWADVVIHDHTTVAVRLAGPLVVEVTAWGGTCPDPGRPDDELIVQAASGLLAASRDEQGRPLRFPGWQTQYLAGAYAAAAALTGLAGGARRAEVTWVGAALSAVEAQAAGELYSAGSSHPAEEARHAVRLAKTFPSGVFACADGWVVPGTVRAEDWLRQCEVYGRPDLVYDRRFVWAHRWDNREQLREELEPWYRAHRQREILAAALAAGWAAAPVLTARAALADAHLLDRRFFAPVVGATRAQVAARPWRGGGVREAVPVRLSDMDEDTAWFNPDRTRRSPVPRPPALRGIRVVELTWAWAGPFVGRFLGNLGADVVRVESGRHPDGWRTRHRLADVAGPTPDDPDLYTWDGGAQFNSLNRSKRGVSVDLGSADGADVFRQLVGAADVLVVNMGNTVLADRGVEEHVRQEVERGLVVVEMPALGTTGPLRSMPGYGMLTEGAGGFAARYGTVAEGARTSGTYYPDAVAGIHGVVAVLSALARRGPSGGRRPGYGARIDLSQQETMWLQFGEGLVLASRDGRDPERMGDREPGTASSGVEARDGRYVAFVERSGAAPRTAVVESVRDLWASGALRERGLVEELDHPVVGRRPYLALPVRLDGRPLPSPAPAPRFDEHTDEVLAAWLGLPAHRIAELRAAEAIGTRPRQPRRRVASR